MKIIVSIIDSDEFYEFENATCWEEDGDWVKFFKEMPVLNGPNITPGLMCLGWVKKEYVEAIEIDEDEDEEESY